MIFPVILALAIASSPVEDFFPLAAGTKWTYEDDSGAQMIEEVGQIMDLGNGQTATPKSQTAAGQYLGTTLYRVDGDAIQVVGYLDQSKKTGNVTLLPSPHAVLRVGLGPKSEWRYVDQVFSVNGPVGVTVAGTAKPGPKRSWAGHEVDTVLVHVDAHIGEGKAAYDVKQDMVYGKTIGLLETTEATKIQGKTVKKVLKLIKFEPPQG